MRQEILINPVMNGNAEHATSPCSTVRFVTGSDWRDFIEVTMDTEGRLKLYAGGPLSIKPDVSNVILVEVRR